MILSDETKTAFRDDVLKRFPEEACGLIIGDKYYACTNAHEKPREQFKITGKERLSLQLAHGTVEAVLHSHPYGPADGQRCYREKYNPAWPSVVDQQQFIDDTCDWGIVATDGDGISDFVWLSQQPKSLDSRAFEWFTSDCYAVVRDWYSLNTNMRLPNFVRPWEFWKNGINTIEDGIATLSHAERIATAKAQVGDMVCFAVAGSKVVNHLAVIVGDNKMLHIFASEQPGALYYAHEVRWDKWKSRARYVVRWHGMELNHVENNKTVRIA